MIDVCGDILIMVMFDDVFVFFMWEFDNWEDYFKYCCYCCYVVVVYFYVVEAIKLFWEVEYVIEYMKDRE